MAGSTTLSFTVPKEIKLKLDAVTHIGYYDSVSEFLRDAIRTILQDRKDLRIAIAYELFTKKQISLGKASEIIGGSIEETKDLFKEREI
jgi:Arc/MetJ-type ribon-helix-helix transcriptional regulator